MEPTLRPGDRVLVDPSAYRRAPPEVGHLVAAVDPGAPTRWLVKRVAAVGPGAVALPTEGVAPGEGPALDVPAGQLFLLSDAPAMGRDSRAFGPIPLGALRGRVWYRIGPPGRRGPL